MPAACKLSAVVRPPIPPPTISAFMRARLARECGPTPVPAAAAFTVYFEALVGDHHGIFKLDEAAFGMLQRRLDRHDHSGLQRLVGIIAIVLDRAAAGEPGRLVTDQSHSMGQEVQVVVLPRFLQPFLRNRINLASKHAWLDRLHGYALNLLDLSQ